MTEVLFARLDQAGPQGPQGVQGNTGATGATGPGYSPATSVTSLTIAGSGSIGPAIVLPINSAYSVGARVRFFSTGSSAFMEGVVTAYTPATGSMTFTADLSSGSGAHTDWTVNIAGQQGIQGPAGSGSVAGGTNHGIAIMHGATSVDTSIVLGADQILTGVAANDPVASTVGGDLTQTGGTFTIGAAKVTYAKFQNVGANSLVGNATGGAATATNITLGSSLVFSGTALQRAALTGDVTASADGNATTLANIPNDVPMVGDILITNTAAPASPASGKNRIYSDSTDLRFHDKNASGVIGTTVVASTAAANKFATAVSTAGVVAYTQPAFTDISGTATTAQLPAMTAWAMYYTQATPTLTALALGATGTAMVSTGASAAPTMQKVLRPAVTDTLTVGFVDTSNSIGTVTGAGQTTTPDPTLGNFQHLTLNGSSLTGNWTFAVPSSGSTQVIVEVTNGGSGAVAATLVTSGYTKVTGDAWATTNGNKYLFIATKSQTYSHLFIQALQ